MPIRRQINHLYNPWFSLEWAELSRLIQRQPPFLRRDFLQDLVDNINAARAVWDLHAVRGGVIRWEDEDVCAGVPHYR